jgi:hypothetical protein
MRFRVNKKLAAWEQMEKVMAEIADVIMIQAGMVRKRLPRHVRLSTIALLTGYVHLRDVLNQLLLEKV